MITDMEQVLLGQRLNETVTEYIGRKLYNKQQPGKSWEKKTPPNQNQILVIPI